MSSLSQECTQIGFKTRDRDEFASILAAYHAPVKVEPVSSKGFAIDSAALLIGGVCVSSASHHSGVRLAFDDTFDGYGLTLPASGSFELGLPGGQALQPKKDSGLIVDSSDITGVTVTAGTEWHRLSVTAHDLHARLSQWTGRPVVRRIRFESDVHSHSPAARAANMFSRVLYDGLQDDAPLLHYPTAATSLHEAMLNFLLEALPNNYSEQLLRLAPLPTPRHVKRAIEFMEANAAQPLRLVDIAAAAGTSARSLQSGFLRFRGISPMEYLRTVRLAGARAELLLGAGAATIRQIAYRWGFPHLSSFSARYARAYGESPSATRRRSTER